jgi:hypothetical protein
MVEGCGALVVERAPALSVDEVGDVIDVVLLDESEVGAPREPSCPASRH